MKRLPQWGQLPFSSSCRTIFCISVSCQLDIFIYTVFSSWNTQCCLQLANPNSPILQAEIFINTLRELLLDNWHHPVQHLEKAMATHSSTLAWRIPGKGEPGGLPSTGSHRVGHDWSELAATVQHLITEGKIQISVFLCYSLISSSNFLLQK